MLTIIDLSPLNMSAITDVCFGPTTLYNRSRSSKTHHNDKLLSSDEQAIQTYSLCRNIPYKFTKPTLVPDQLIE